jgi:pimeloyl-ACP methyl ester carboxylesterase
MSSTKEEGASMARKLFRITLPLAAMAIILAACGASAASPIPATETASAAVATAAPIPPTATAVPSAATATAIPQAAATEVPEMRGNFEANGRSLYLLCMGTGSPTIVLEAHEGGTVSVMRKLQERLAARTTTCAYDRANLSFSGSAPTPRTAKDVVDDLHALLAASAVPGPYLLVGQDAGGLFVQLYARTYPDQVVGVVALDPTPPAHPWLDEVSQIFTAQEYASEKTSYSGKNSESIDYVTSSEQLAAAPKPPDVPFEVLVTTDCDEGDQGCLNVTPTYERILREVTASWPRGTFSEIVAGGSVWEDDPGAAVAAVERVLPKP